MALPVVSLACVLLASPGDGAESLSGSRPNIIFVLTDDCGWGEIGAAGNPILKTSNLDRLYRESTRFTNFQVAPSCAPTRAQFMTGNHNFRSGVTNTIRGREFMNPKAVTVAQVLKKAGYATGHFGKWHLGLTRAGEDYMPHNRGYDMALVEARDSQHSHDDPKLIRNGKPETIEGYRTDVLFNEAMKWIEANKQGPFFCSIPTYSPHTPLVVPDDYAEPYRNRGLRVSKFTHRNKPSAPKRLDSAANYYGMIANIDMNVGRLLDFVESQGLADNTVVIYATDNGHAMSGPAGAGHRGDGFLGKDGLYNMGLRGGKSQPWLGGTCVPFFVRWPGRVRAGQEVGRVAGAIDFLPTLADLAGIAVEHNIDGKSLIPLIENPQADVADRMLFVHAAGFTDKATPEDRKHFKYAVQTDHWRLVNGSELYDHRTDRGERHNVAAQHPELVGRLQAAYEDWWADVRPMMINDVPPTSSRKP